MWKIKDIEVDGRVVLAPMAGITNVAYREFMKPFGVALSYTEMVSDCGLIYNNQETYRYLEISPKEHPVGIQLFGGSKETLLAAIDIIENRSIDYDFIEFMNSSLWRKLLGMKLGPKVKRVALKQADIEFVKNKYGIVANDDVCDAICLYTAYFTKPQEEYNWE